MSDIGTAIEELVRNAVREEMVSRDADRIQNLERSVQIVERRMKAQFDKIADALGVDKPCTMQHLMSRIAELRSTNPDLTTDKRCKLHLRAKAQDHIATGHVESATIFAKAASLL